MRKHLFLLIGLSISLNICAQGWQIEAVIENLPDQKIHFLAYDQSEYISIDSTFCKNGSFYFHLNESLQAGMYRILFAKTANKASDKQESMYIEFIWNKENIQIFADTRDLLSSIEFGNSAENDLLNTFHDNEEIFTQKMSAIFALIDHYPIEDAYYTQTKKQALTLQRKRDSMLASLTKKHPQLYASSIISSYRNAEIPSELTGKAREDYVKDHYFEISGIENRSLLRAPIYSKKIIQYLGFYGDQNFTFTEQEDAFIEAIDIIMANTSGDTDLRVFVVEFLTEGFESFGMEKVQTHLLENYMDETCTTDVLALAKKRTEGYKKMAIGQTVQDIIVRNDNNKIVKLSDLKADYTLIMFWATHCEHCMKMMPKMIDWYENDRSLDIEVFAVSIDTVMTDWKRYSEEYQLSWINTHEAMGWEGQSAEDYNIYATPTMFLVDRKREIIAKPFNFRDLKKTLSKIED